MSEAARPLSERARERHDVFEALIEAVTSRSPGQLRHTLYDVGGEHRRNM